MARGQKKSAAKLLARVPGKVPAKIYRGRLVLAEHVKYLDLAALTKAPTATIEIGSVEAAGLTVPMIAEVRKGVVVGLRPLHCKGCEPPKGKTAGGADRKRAAKAALQRVRDLGLQSVKLPMPVARLFGLIIGPFGPIIIVIDWEFCIIIDTDTETCFYCTSTGSWCLSKDP